MINKRLKDALSVDEWSELCMDTLGRFGYVLVSDLLLLEKSLQSRINVSNHFQEHCLAQNSLIEIATNIYKLNLRCTDVLPNAVLF